MKIKKHDSQAFNIKQVLFDPRLSWGAKGIYAQLTELSDRSVINLIKLSTYAKNDVNSFKIGLKELSQYGYLVINNKLLIIKDLKTTNKPLIRNKAMKGLIIRHDQHITDQFLQNQWLIVWHRDDSRVTRALAKLAKYLDPAIVMYGIQLSKEKCHSYRESLPYLNCLIMEWKRHGLTSVEQAQNWMKQRKLNTKPWNSEIQDRIFGSHPRTTLNNSPLHKGIPDVFKKHRK